MSFKTSPRRQRTSLSLAHQIKLHSCPHTILCTVLRTCDRLCSIKCGVLPSMSWIKHFLGLDVSNGTLIQLYPYHLCYDILTRLIIYLETWSNSIFLKFFRWNLPDTPCKLRYSLQTEMEISRITWLSS